MCSSDLEEQDGISFLLIYFSHRQECYYLRFAELKKYWDRMKAGGPKHFKYAELEKEFFVPCGNGAAIHYLVTLQKDLKERKQ